MTKDHGKQIKDDAKYEALRRQGESKEKAARIANSTGASRRGGGASRLEKRTKSELLGEAKKIGITGTHKMNKSRLIDAIRNH
ncbi:Rho termination factor N-terminal domain-containing protein [Sphingobacterium sp. LRF_L2]|uniref:Rho termination factor N-terminal domain-containing protein n=1 Tax=Sphingobacterium sp. LRF_L2 TaxID=3369421 RepID=UPI003F5DCBD5